MCRFPRSFAKLSVLFAVTLLMPLYLCSPTTAAAFGLSGIDARAGVVDPDGVDGTLEVGGGLNFQQADSRVHLMPNVLFWSEGGLSDVNTNFDASYHFEPAGVVSPYLGAGIGAHFYSSDGPSDPGTDVGPNFFGGVSFPLSGASLYMEGRAAVTDRSQFGFLTGATFYLGH
jgi:hypothetical protein